MKKYLGLAVAGSLTLGLAPFVPHPHIWKQLKNLWFGRTMLTMDWLDLLMHGAPWIALIVILIGMAVEKKRANDMKK
ncbi:MAG: hypothetical protein P8P74_04185 [Crocinitomicaceae bacterium]|nr:hypothetical protein [Crocinitomicaceae bacterium]